MQEIPISAILKTMTETGRAKIAELDGMSQNPMLHNETLLMDIIRKNQDTGYGRQFDFADIRTISDYKARVPFTNYDSYSDYIEDMKNGKDSFTTKEQPVAFAATSGSVGNPKAIPVSEKTLETYRDYGTSFGMAVIERDLKGAWKYNKVLNLSEIKLRDTPCGKKYGPISGLLLYSMKHVMSALCTSPEECVFPRELMESIYIHARFALEYKELSGIFSSFMTIAVDFLNYIKKNWKILTDDIENGTIHEKVDIPRDIREALLKKIQPNPNRAQELREEFTAGFDSTIVKRIWPELAFIHTIGSGGFSAYTNKFREYAGVLPICNSGFMASEAFMAVCTKVNSDHYVLMPDSAFYEFIPVEHTEDEHPETMTLDQLEIGKNYEIVVTNTAGFYRYRIQDVVKVVGMYNNCPEIQFAYRLNQMISLAGEKTNGEHFRWSVSELEKETGCGISECAIYPDTDDETGKYVVFLEAVSQEATDELIRNEAVAKILQEKLSIANPSYGAKVQSGIIGKLEVKYAQQQTFALYRDIMAMRGISPNQIKPVRVIDTPEKEKFFFRFTEDQ